MGDVGMSEFQALPGTKIMKPGNGFPSSEQPGLELEPSWVDDEEVQILANMLFIWDWCTVLGTRLKVKPQSGKG